VLDSPPKSHIFDGEPVALDAAGCPLFNELLLWPTYVVDLLMADGVDLRSLPLKRRKAASNVTREAGP
jgi:ATP-dependent DNA ligase